MTDPDAQIQVEETSSGVTMRITVQPRQTNGTELFMYWGSVLWTITSLGLLFSGGDAILPGLMFTGIGIFGLFISFSGRNLAWRGSDALYSCTCENRVVTFSRDDYTQTFELAKLGRIWFTKRTRNGQPSGVDLTAYYDGIERHIFDIIELNSVSDDAYEFLNRIGAYLNNTADAAHSVRTADRPDHVPDSSPRPEDQPVASLHNTADAIHEVLIGFRPDYASGTSPLAKDQRELASASLRLLFSSLAALPMLVYFSEMSHWPVNLLIGIVVAPILFGLAVTNCRSCTCRYRRPSDFIIWPMIAALAGLALKVMSDFMATKEGLPGLSLIIMPVVFIVMAGIIFRIISGCSCGARLRTNRHRIEEMP